MSVMHHKVLAALLHMGNIKYKSTSEKNMEASNIPDLTNVERVAAILGLTKNALLQVSSSQSSLFSSSSTCLQSSASYLSHKCGTYPKIFESKVILFQALTTRTIHVQGESVTSNINTEQAGINLSLKIRQYNNFISKQVFL